MIRRLTFFINLRIFQMRRADRITVAPCGDDSFEQVVEVAAMRGDLTFVENVNAFEKTVAVERRDLLPHECRGIFDAERVEAQVALDLVKFVVVGNDFEL